MRVFLITLVILASFYSIDSKKLRSSLIKPKSFLTALKLVNNGKRCDDLVDKSMCDRVKTLQSQRSRVTTPKPESVLIEGAQRMRQRFLAQDFAFDLAKSNPVATEGGERREVNVDVLPALNGQGVSSVLFHLEPCAVNLPHTHPRGTELFFVVEGWFQAGFLEENNGRLILNELRKGQLTFFPRGLIHFEQNLSCQRSTFYSTFNSEDPGVITISNRLFDAPENILTSALNQSESSVSQLKSRLASNPALGRGECLKRCGLV